MRIEGQLERARELAASIEDAEGGVASAEEALALAQERSAAAQARLASVDGSGDDGDASEVRREAGMADAAVSAAQDALDRAHRELDAAREARSALVADVTSYVVEQGRAVSGLAAARAAGPYGADALDRTRDQAARHAALGNRVLQILGASEVHVDEGVEAHPDGGGGASTGAASPFPEYPARPAGDAGAPGAGRWGQGLAGGVPTALDGLVDSFRTELARRLGFDASAEGLLFSRGRGERLVGFDQIVGAQALLDEYENRLSGTPGGSLVMGELRKACEGELFPRTLERPLVAARDRTDVPAEQPGHCNPNPGADIEASYLLSKRAYGAGSPEAVDAAWRYAELLEAERASVGSELNAVRGELGVATERYYAFCDGHPLHLLSDGERRQYDSLRMERDRALGRERALLARKNALDVRHAEVTSGLDKDSRTVFVGLWGCSDFAHAYDPFVTHPQGYEYDDVRGCCGIGSTESIVNEQLGTHHGWAFGIDEYLAKKRTSYVTDQKFWAQNGSTKPIAIVQTLREHGLNAQVDYEITPERIVELRREGCSLGMGVRAQDLRCSGLAPRQANDLNTMKANHAVTIAGVSVDKGGRPKVVWINDTGGWLSGGGLRTNRIPINVEKFELMQEETPGFAVYGTHPEPPGDWDASAFDASRERT